MSLFCDLRRTVEVLENIAFGLIPGNSDEFDRLYSHFEGCLAKSQIEDGFLELRDRGFTALGYYRAFESLDF